MASVFGHTALGATLGVLLLQERWHWRWWALAAACAFLPDADVIGFKFHVPYAGLWGHRGLTHSILAAAVVATVLVGFYSLRRATLAPALTRIWVLLFLATASHGVLDAMTTAVWGLLFSAQSTSSAIFSAFVPFRYFPLVFEILRANRQCGYLLVKWSGWGCLAWCFC